MRFELGLDLLRGVSFIDRQLEQRNANPLYRRCAPRPPAVPSTGRERRTLRATRLGALCGDGDQPGSRRGRSNR